MISRIPPTCCTFLLLLLSGSEITNAYPAPQVISSTPTIQARAARARPSATPVSQPIDVPGVTELGSYLGRLIPVPLSDGDGIAYGDLSSSLRWQSSGTLNRNGCPLDVAIQNCFSLHLDGNGNLQDPAAIGRRQLAPTEELLPDAYFLEPLDRYVDTSGAWEDFGGWEASVSLGYLNRAPCTVTPTTTSAAVDTPMTTTTRVRPIATASADPRPTTLPPSARQRIEFLTWPPHNSGSTLSASWRSFQAVDTLTSAHFFHQFQIIRRDLCGGPVISLDLTGGQAKIIDNVRECNPCVFVPVQDFLGKTIQHNLVMTFGPTGSLTYSATDVGTGQVLLEYVVPVGDMGDRTSLKFGNYRAWFSGIAPSDAFVGDFTATLSN